MGRSSADAARTLASGFATCSGDAYEMGDVIGVGGFGRCVVVLRASSSALDVCSRRVPARLPASRLTLASSLVASSSRSVRACRRRDDAAPSPRPLAVKAVRLAPSPRDVRSAGAESSAGPRPPNPAERLAAEIDALRRVASTASDSPRARLLTALVDVFVLDDVAHLVLTRLAATDRDLSRVLDDAPDRRLPESRARRYAAQIALALDHIHRAAKLVHLDLKPENVLVDDRDVSGRVAVCDFDLARPVADDVAFVVLERLGRRRRHGGIPRPGDHRRRQTGSRRGLVGVRGVAVRDDARRDAVPIPVRVSRARLRANQTRARRVSEDDGRPTRDVRRV